MARIIQSTRGYDVGIYVRASAHVDGAAADQYDKHDLYCMCGDHARVKNERTEYKTVYVCAAGVGYTCEVCDMMGFI